MRRGLGVSRPWYPGRVLRRHTSERRVGGRRGRAPRRAATRFRFRHALGAHLRWYLHLFGREVYRGLIHSGGGMITPAAVEHFLLTVPGARLDGPPPGHPERLEPWRPLSARERALWEQLSN